MVNLCSGDFESNIAFVNDNANKQRSSCNAEAILSLTRIRRHCSLHFLLDQQISVKRRSVPSRPLFLQHSYEFLFALQNYQPSGSPSSVPPAKLLPTMSVTTVNLLALASNPLYFDTLAATNITQPAISLLSYDPSFTQSVIYPNATARLLSQPGWQAYHEGGVYDSATHALYVSSNYQSLADNINMTIVHLNQNWTVANVTSSQFPNLWEANGGTSYYPPGSDTSKPPPQQVWCDEGDFQHYSGLVAIDPAKNTSTVLLNSFLGGHNFSSVNDVRQHPITGDLWFTDAAYGYFQNFRPVPSIPQQVYRFEPATGVLQVIADGFDQPNGLVSLVFLHRQLYT